MPRVLAALALLVLVGCREVTGPTVVLDQQFILAPGQVATISNTPLRVGFDGVEGDSRCPADAVCITGGDARVKIHVIDGSGRKTSYELHTGDMKPVTHQTLTISLIELSPYPFSSSPIKKDDYRATLRLNQ
jgi:hypothetical protein